MVLTDQQLRQELINYGEIVPPITQRNREQLRARLEVLRSQKKTRSTASPSRAHGTSSPSRTRSTASPSASPSRTRATASTASPTRNRSSTSSNTGRGSSSSRTTRSKQTTNLIELSDSEAESGASGVLMSRSLRSGQTAPSVQKRSIALRSQQDVPTGSSISPGKMTNDVELSIARHRREIKQLLETARDRPRPTSPSITSLHSDDNQGSGHRQSPTSATKPRSRQQSSQSDNDDDNTKSKRLLKSNDNDNKQKSSPSKQGGKSSQSSSSRKKLWDFIKNLLKALIVSSILLGGIFVILKNRHLFLPPAEGINCSVKNATECEDMKPVIAAVRKQLQVRTGEVDCGFRPKYEVFVRRNEIERYLNEKGLKFNLGNEERWNALLRYITDKPIKDILLWNDNNTQTTNRTDVTKLSTEEALRSLTCRARQDVSKTIRNAILLVLGSTGLLTLAWYLQRNSKRYEENERTFKNHLNKAKKLIQEQYEKHVQDPQSQPWVAINQIRDKLIPEQDQERLKHIWERVKQEITKQDSRIRSEMQEINGKTADVWRWIKSAASSPKQRQTVPKTTTAQVDDDAPSEVGLTECLKIRNCFRSDNYADDEEIDHVVDSIQNRCANVKRIEHIGIHSVFVYLKFSSKEAAAQGYHLLNNWNYQGRNLNVKYVRLNRYYEHFPEARDLSGDN